MRHFFSPLLLLLATWSLAQEDQNFPPPEIPVEVQARKVSNVLNVDGWLDEADWQTGTATDDFFRVEPRQGGKIRYKTQVKFLYDEKNLYIGAWCMDSVGLKGIRVQDLRRDFGWGENDIFGIALDPQNLKQYAQAFQTTPYGNQRDLQNFNGNNFDNGWNTLWRVRTQRSEDGYTVEMSIPFKTLRYDLPEAGKPVEWGVTLVRYARRDIEVSTFPAIPQSFTPYRMTYAAKLTGIEVPPPSANIRIEPYTLYQYDKIADGTNNTSEGNFKVGGDMKWAINPRSVLDLTFNTDFAQADVDRAVNNLERFNIFFPEQRQFFLENSGIWAGSGNTSLRPFFSRRIGLQGTFNAVPAPIDVGARFTNRTDQQAIAGLFVRQRETNSSPAANFGVLRYLRNYGRENNIGMMVTQRVDEQLVNTGTATNNTTITVDGRIRPTSDWDVQYMVTSSIDEASETTGFAGRFQVSRNSNKWFLNWNTEVIDGNYNPGIGFVRQSNLISHNTGGYYIWRPKVDWIRRWDPGVFTTFNHDAEDVNSFQQANIYIFPVYTWFKDNSFVEMSLFPTWQNINFAFSPLGLTIAEDNYYYTRYFLRYNTDQSKKLAGGVTYSFGGFYNGTRNTLNTWLRLAPIPHVALTADYEFNDLNDVGIEESDLTTHLVTIGSRFALNPRVQLSAFYQYNSFDEQGRWNVRASWEYQPLSFVYLVFNDTRIDGLENPFEEQQFIGKVTFLKQF